jgi:hypothetical protein
LFLEAGILSVSISPEVGNGGERFDGLKREESLRVREFELTFLKPERWCDIRMKSTERDFRPDCVTPRALKADVKTPFYDLVLQISELEVRDHGAVLRFSHAGMILSFRQMCL